ncbi:X-ray radiation resistance-associated protein 1 isoform X1 [Xiphophorus couchianus]|uniref:X-ray radiation resistance-associated protein 1 isoform X1 n=1 Tax=Xiphophorus couchianus TaxID=32473 RepID=UPI001015DDE2|nr:X-ray radiation resistance-associated protein 1 isoform X1 [Xiphophorus couchianus]XP_027886858.1 X-ray radiation resistance-associated protein 1 isoform X1 [Xiphophorus couchianus]
MKKINRKEAGFRVITHRKPKQQKDKSVQKWTKTTPTKGVNKDGGAPAQTTLDGRLLLQLHCVDKPSHLYSVDITERNLTSVEPEELKAFVNVTCIDASDNFLSLGSFSSFTSLRELDLTMNRIKNMDFDVADFPHLEVLNLSFNNLQAEVLLNFGQFPRLKTLHLTGNQLSCLPPNFGPSHSDQSDMLSEEGAKQFEALEVLMLNYNSLTSSVFYNLRNLKRLKHLNLEGNHITEIPCKEVMESSKPALREGEEEDIESKIDHHIEIMEILHVLREDRCSSVLLPELQCLNLADNQIASEEAVVPAALFPKLCELHIHCNPLTTQRRGETALLTYFLQDKLGIKIKREKDEDFLQPPLKVCVYPAWKDKKRTKSDLRTIRPEDKSKGKSRENAKRFFITQTEDEAELQLASSSNQNASAQNRACPGRPVRYDMIMDVKPFPCIGIQTAVQMLDQTLRNLNIYRDSKPRLDSIQTPYSEMKKRIEELPPLRPIKQPIQRVEELLKEMKDNRAAKVVSLGSVIHNRAANSKDHREALFLLRELKKTHRMVHDNTMEQEARFQCEHPH